IKKVPTLRGKTIINLFMEPSTRTRTSFEIAAKRQSADAINISGASSSTVKGETLIDTAKNLQAMAPDVAVLRHGAAGGPALIAPPGGVRVHDRLDEVLPEADVVMMLRIQQERLGAGGFFPNLREYSRTFGLGLGRAARLKPDALIMHPGPVNRGIEIDPAV